MRHLPQLLIALTFTLLTGCATVGQNTTGIQNFAKVSPELYRGAQPTPEGIQFLAQQSIKTVVNLRHTDEIDPREAELVRQAGMEYFSLPQDARKATFADADRFLAILAKAPTPIFVHCHAGRDRTGLAVAAYRIRTQNWTRKAALKELYAHGHYWALFPRIADLVSTMTSAPTQVFAEATERASKRVDSATGEATADPVKN